MKDLTNGHSLKESPVINSVAEPTLLFSKNHLVGYSGNSISSNDILVHLQMLPLHHQFFLPKNKK